MHRLTLGDGKLLIYLSFVLQVSNRKLQVKIPSKISRDYINAVAMNGIPRTRAGLSSNSLSSLFNHKSKSEIAENMTKSGKEIYL